MKTVLRITVAGLAVLSLFIVASNLSSAVLVGPTVDSPIIAPSSVSVGQPTLMTVTSRVTGTTANPVLPTSVNLLRVNQNDQAIATIGVMNDSGSDGDAVSGDGIFTLKFTTTEAVAGEMRLRVSAGFKGMLKRVLSSVSTVPIVSSNRPPVANAGSDQTINVGTLVQLDGSTSNDPDGNPLTYNWTITLLPSGSTAVLSSKSAVMPSFVADRSGTYDIQLTVNDGLEDSQSDSVRITTQNSAPLANAGPDQTESVGSSVQLDGSGSSDVDGDALHYSWSFVSKPAGSSAVLSDLAAVNSTFVIDRSGNYILQLIVNDGVIDSVADAVSITTQNSSPVANAGADQSVGVGNVVQLDGSGSTDVDGDSLTYSWSFTSIPQGSSASLSTPTSVNPTFPVDLPGTYVAQLIVNDGHVDSTPDTVVITTQNSTPIANAGLDQTATVGSLIQLDGSGSSDPDHDSLTYAWSFITKPENSIAALNNSTEVNPGFILDLPGTYVIQLIVNDGHVNSQPDTVTVTTGNSAPVANAGPDQTLCVGRTAQLNGGASSDADGGPLSYSWSFNSRPPGSAAVLLNPTSSQPGFTADVPGLYVVQLIVNDGLVDSVPNTVSIDFRSVLTVTGLALLTRDSGLMTVSMSCPAPASGQLINLSSSNATVAKVDETVLIPAGSMSATANVTTDITKGTAVITAFAPGFFDGIANLNVNNRQMSVAFDGELIGIGANRATTGTVTLNNPAPTGGVTVTLSSNAATIATVSTSHPGTCLGGSVCVFIPALGTGAEFTVTGLLPGQATIMANGDGFSDASLGITVTNSNLIQIPSNFVIAPEQTLGYPISLSDPAGSGGLTVTLTNSNPGVAILPPNVFIPAGATAPLITPQIIGGPLASLNSSAQISASAPTYAPDHQLMTLRLGISFATPSVTVVTNNTATIELDLGAPAPSTEVRINLSTDDPSKATAPLEAIFPQGSTSIQITVTGIGVGNTILRASGNGIAETTADVIVNPAGAITLSNVTVGRNLQVMSGGSLSAPAPAGNVSVTIASGDPSKVLLSKTSSAPGSSQITLEVGAGSSAIPSFFIQSLADSGSVQLQATALNHSPGTGTVTLIPSGFRINTSNINTTVTSANSPVTVSVVALNPGVLTVYDDTQRLRAGINVNVPFDTSDHTVGVMTITPLVFNAGDLSNSTSAFDPIGGGTTTIFVTQPSGFTTPTAQTQITATVSAPAMNLSSGTVGKDLQTSLSGSLTGLAPAGNLEVTITPAVADRSRLRLSNVNNALTDSSVDGSIKLQVAAGSSGFPTFYVHSLSGSGTAQIKATAPGFAQQTATITFVPSGFVMSPCASTFLNCGFPVNSTINTTSLSTNTTVSVFTAALSATTLAPTTNLPIRASDPASPLGPISVNIISGTPTVGTMTLNPVIFGTNEISKTTAFDPIVQGTTVLSLEVPATFSTPSVGRQITAIVAGPRIFLSNNTLGKDLQGTVSVSLEAPAPAGNLLVTITSSDINKLRVSSNSTNVGTDTVTLTIFAGNSSGSFVINAMDEQGSVQLTAAANNYTSGTSTVTLVPSGFILTTQSRLSGCIPCSSPISTTTLSSNSSLFVYPAQLNPTTHAYSVWGILRAGVSPANVIVTSGTPAVGTITTSPVVYNANDIDKSTAFHPLSVGTSTISLQTPAGFTTPNNFQTVDATVILPSLSLGSFEIGKDFQVQASASLGAAAPSGGVTMTLSVADPTRVRLSTNANVLGDETGTLVFNIPQGQSSVPTYYIQSLASSGSIQFTASAPGFNSVTRTITLFPSGFLLMLSNQCPTCSGTTFNMQTTDPNRSLFLSPAYLDASTLNYRGLGTLRAGIGPVNVSLSNDNTNAGMITVSPVSFAVGEISKSSAFDPIAVGTSILTLVTPSGFSTPSNFQTLTAIVSAPPTNINVPSSITVGKDLQTISSLSLGSPAPAGGVSVTLTTDSSRALLSNSPTTLGSGSVALNIPQGQSSATFYLQALVNSGTSQINASAPGYTNASGSITFRPSGFVISLGGCVNCGGTTINTHTLASTTSIGIFSAYLDPVTLNYASQQNLRAGISPVSVNITSDNPSVGTIITSPVIFNGNDVQKSTAFDPVGFPADGGSTVLRVENPVGFTVASNFQTITANVNQPRIFVSDTTVGKDLQLPLTVSLEGAAPAGGVNLTISVTDANVLRVSSSATTLGSDTGQLSLPIPAGQSSAQIFAQALAASGTVQITFSAPGFGPKTITITLFPSGFAITNLGTSFNTTVTASNTTINIAPAALNPVTLNVHQTQQLRPGMTNTLVDVFTEDPAHPCANPPTGPPDNPCNSTVGTITVSPLQFNGADNPNSRTTSFHPAAVGSTVIRVRGRGGFSVASNNNNVTANVN